MAAQSRCSNFSLPDSTTTIRKINCEPDPGNMDVDDYDQYELFQELQGKEAYWDKCQWLKDPLFRKLNSDLMALPNTEGWLQKWFSSEEILEASEPLYLSMILVATANSSRAVIFSLKAAGFPANVYILRRNEQQPKKN